MLIRINTKEVLIASTELTNAKIGKLLIEACKQQMNVNKEDYVPQGEEVFLWNSFTTSIKIANDISKKAKINANIRWSNKGE